MLRSSSVRSSVARTRAAFARWEARNAPAQDEEGRARAGVAAPLDAAELERLRELGYAP